MQQRLALLSLSSCFVCARDGERRRRHGDDEGDRKKHRDKESRHRDRDVDVSAFFSLSRFLYFKRKKVETILDMDLLSPQNIAPV